MRKSIFHSHFRRKYITGEAYITRRQAYITALHSKAISLRVVHIPMRNTLKPGRAFFSFLFFEKVIYCKKRPNGGNYGFLTYL